MGAANDILANYQHVVETFTFTTGSKGVFDVTVDGELLYSKAKTGRHAEPGEVLQRFTERYGEGVARYAES